MSYLLIRMTLHLEHQAEDGIRDDETSRGLGDVYKRQVVANEPPKHCKEEMTPIEN